LTSLADVIDYDHKKATHPVLSSSLIPMLHFLIAQRDGSKVIALDKERTLLPPDTYQADIFVLLGGREHARVSRRFAVMTEGMKWLV
jgi:hypothetical protein